MEPAASLTEQWAEKMNLRKMESVSYTMLSDSFDERFLAYLSEHAEGNYMVSPLSFRYALGLLLAGANGETKAELLQALGVSSEEEWIEHCLDFNGFVATFAADLEREREEYRYQKEQGWIPAGTPEPEIFRALRVANSVWKAEQIKEEFKEGYKESVEKNYAAEYRSFTAENANVKVTIPKIDLETDFSNGELIDFLKECGVSLAFDERKAGFSAMIDHPVFVSDIIQKTRIKQDEEGVEAAAVTFIGMDEKGLAVPNEPKVFNADRPVSFYIYTTCNDTTAMMFAGEIVE